LNALRGEEVVVNDASLLEVRLWDQRQTTLSNSAASASLSS
jgi:hypothetical protein